MANFVFSEWIKHDGKGIPVLAETFVLVKFRDGVPTEDQETFVEDMTHFRGSMESTYRANYWSDTNPEHNQWVWTGKAEGGDIVEYQVVTEIPDNGILYD